MTCTLQDENTEPQWPFIRHTEVRTFLHQLCETIEELERAVQDNRLESLFSPGTYANLIGPDLSRTYAKLLTNPPSRLIHLRSDAVRMLLEQLKSDLNPVYIAHAVPCETTEHDPALTDKEDHQHPLYLPYRFNAGFQSNTDASLRVDQMETVRFWRIGFTFDSGSHSDTFALRNVRHTTQRLASNLTHLQRTLEDYHPITQPEKVVIVSHPSQKRFEHLIVDVLNEHHRRAGMANVYADFLEKTDLRVKYPGLNRRKGARVQVTSINAPDLHQAKIEAMRAVDEYVFLSPLTLAEYISTLQGRSTTEQKSETHDLASLAAYLGSNLTDVDHTSARLKRILLSALNGAPSSPLGPMMKVPAPLRELIRAFAKSRAFASTERLREREQEQQSPHAPDIA